MESRKMVPMNLFAGSDGDADKIVETAGEGDGGADGEEHQRVHAIGVRLGGVTSCSVAQGALSRTGEEAGRQEAFGCVIMADTPCCLAVATQRGKILKKAQKGQTQINQVEIKGATYKGMPHTNSRAMIYDSN